MVKIKNEFATRRMFENMCVCMKCNARMRTKDPDNTKCRKCGHYSLRHKHKEKKV